MMRMYKKTTTGTVNTKTGELVSMSNMIDLSFATIEMTAIDMMMKDMQKTFGAACPKLPMIPSKIQYRIPF